MPLQQFRSRPPEKGRSSALTFKFPRKAARDSATVWAGTQGVYQVWHVITVAFSTQRLNHFLRLPHLPLCSFGQWSFILFASICHYIMLHRFVFQSWSISSSEWNKTVGSESSPLSKRSMCELASEFWVGSSSRLEYGRIWLNRTAWINSINL